MQAATARTFFERLKEALRDTYSSAERRTN
jgi:hypothetical protein